MARVQLLAREKDCLLFCSIQTGSGAQPDSYSRCARALAPDIKQPVVELNTNLNLMLRSKMMQLYVVITILQARRSRVQVPMRWIF
jgi:hypothetical protein